MKNIDIVIDSRVTNDYFANVNTFTEYKKFEILLVGRIVEKRINFSIAGWGTIRMTIEVEDGKEIGFTL